MHKFKLLTVTIFTSLVMTIGAFPIAVSAAPAPPPGGLTAKIVADSGDKITGNIDATGYDIGVYIGPGVQNVIVTHARIHGASMEGILVQEASHISITGNTVENNGDPAAYLADPNNPPSDSNPRVIAEGKAIELAGTTDSIVKNNIVRNNNADGGIGLSDSGPVLPALPFFGGPNTEETVPVASTGNIITGNQVIDNALGCGIVISAWNPGGGVANNVVSENTLEGGIGSIVVAADLPDTTVTNNVVLNNKVKNSIIMGIIVHSNAPGDVVSDTQIIGNILSGNGDEGDEHPFDPSSPTGIAVVAEVPGPGGAVLKGTNILNNTISHEYYGVWVNNAESTNIYGNTYAGVTVDVGP